MRRFVLSVCAITCLVAVRPAWAQPPTLELDDMPHVELSVGVGAIGVGLSEGSGAVLPKRLRIAWLPTYASPTGTPIHGGGGTTTPLWPPLLPVYETFQFNSTMQLEPVVQPTDGGPFAALAGAAPRTSETTATIAAENADIARYFMSSPDQGLHCLACG